MFTTACRGNLGVWGVIRWTEKRGNGRAAQKTASTSVSSPFPGTMTTETTVSKGQEFFSPGQTEGDTGGTLIGSAAVSLLLLTQTKMDNVCHLNKEFNSQLSATLDGHDGLDRENERDPKKQGVLETDCFHVSLREGHPVLPYDNIICLLRWTEHRESVTNKYHHSHWYGCCLFFFFFF